LNEPTPQSQDGGASRRPRHAYIYRHTVSFEETNVVGNVYFARHVAWQGRCREMFLRERMPQIIDDLAADLRLVTLKVSCEYYQELRAFDEIEIAMCLAYQHAHRIGLNFEYFLFRDSDQTLVARGFQEIACMRVAAGGLTPAALPPMLAQELLTYGAASLRPAQTMPPT
jgi:enediyne biosynthesis thioesterase